jgi:hypothetical protein
MRTYRDIAILTAVSATLLAATYTSAAADSGQQSGGATDQAQPPGDQSTPDGGNPIPSDQLSKESQNLSPAARAALANQLKSKGLDELSSMSEGDAKTAFAGLSPDVKAQIQAKWDALSDEQRIAFKKMGSSAIKELVASQVKDIMKQSMSPVLKPVQQIVEKVQSMGRSAKALMQRGRDYVQGLIAKYSGQANQPEREAR